MDVKEENPRMDVVNVIKHGNDGESAVYNNIILTSWNDGSGSVRCDVDQHRRAKHHFVLNPVRQGQLSDIHVKDLWKQVEDIAIDKHKLKMQIEQLELQYKALDTKANEPAKELAKHYNLKTSTIFNE